MAKGKKIAGQISWHSEDRSLQFIQRYVIDLEHNTVRLVGSVVEQQSSAAPTPEEAERRKRLREKRESVPVKWPDAITAAPDLVERIKICESNQCGQFIRRCCGSGAPGCRALDPYADSGDVEPGERRDANPRKLYAAITRNGCPLGHFGKR